MKKIVTAVLASLILANFAFAQDEPEAAKLRLFFPTTPSGPNALKLDFPLFNLPYQITAANTLEYGFFESYTHPSMGGVLNITADLYGSFHYGMKRFYDGAAMNKSWKNVIYYGGIFVGDSLLAIMPFLTGGSLWMHESFHRAVFTQAGIRSHIEYYGVTNAATVSDPSSWDDYTRVDDIRMSAAGLEGEYLLVEKMQRNNFFYGQNNFNEVLYWLENVRAWGYAYMPFMPFFLDVFNMGASGPDSYQWANKLFLGDTPAAESFLKRRTLWSLVNLASPMMFGIRSIPLGKDTGWYGNFALRQLFTSFGTDFSVNAYLKKDRYNFAFAYHSYINYDHYFFAIEVEMLDYPVKLGKLDLLLSPRGIIGAQPRNQGFMTSEPEFFGLLGTRVDFVVGKHFLPYVDVSLRTDGWIAGEESVSPSFPVGFKAGVSLRF
jgi:hypothetical protein